MSTSTEEVVFYHNDDTNITVTDQRVIFGRTVLQLENIRVFTHNDLNSIGNYLLTVVLALVAIWLIFFMTWWTVLIALLLLLHPYTTFKAAGKKELLIDLRSGDSPDVYPKVMASAEAVKLCDAVRLAFTKHQEDTDPRKGLKL